VRQRSQKTTAETNAVPTAALRYTVGLTDVPDIAVQTTSSGSMTQEIFLIYTKHFVSTLPPSHGPVILFLDGHGSRWNKHALHYLVTFFLASHTSIWAQPNDAGVNKHFHWAIEQACEKVRRTLNVPTIEYFNTNIVNGWHLFLSTERDDLQKVGFNNAMNAFWRTGLFPYNPYSEAWTDAMKTIGQAQPISGAAQYKVFPNKDLTQLSELESKSLRNGLELDDLKLHDILNWPQKLLPAPLSRWIQICGMCVWKTRHS